MTSCLRNVLFIVSISTLTNCGSKEASYEAPSQTSMDVQVPKEGVVTPTQLKNLGIGFSNFIQDGESEVPLKELTDAMKIEGPLAKKMPEILATRESTAIMNCKGRVCRVVSLGEDYSFVADWINVPVFGKPTIYLSPVIAIEVNLSADNNKAEMCMISGIKAKSSVLNANVDGLRFELENDAIKEFLLDTGSGVTYPTDACNPDRR